MDNTKVSAGPSYLFILIFLHDREPLGAEARSCLLTAVPQRLAQSVNRMRWLESRFVVSVVSKMQNQFSIMFILKPICVKQMLF